MAELETMGIGEVERIADQATLRVRYVSRAKERNAAVTALTRLVAAAEAKLDRDGVTVRSRQMTSYDTYNGNKRIGTEASQAYQLLVTDVGVLNDLLGDLVATEPAELNSPQWGIKDRSAAYRAAQAKAVEDALAVAQGYADALGARLGALLRLEDASPRVHSPAEASVSYRRLSRSATAYQPDMAELSLEPQPVIIAATCKTAWELLS